MNHREMAAAALALCLHPDVLDLETMDAQWYASPNTDWRRPLTRDDREAARLWLLVHTHTAAFEAMAAGFRAMAEQLGRAFGELAEAFSGLRANLVEAGLVPDTPPTDPKARALHLVKHRNTGPAVAADPRRNRVNRCH